MPIAGGNVMDSILRRQRYGCGTQQYRFYPAQFHRPLCGIPDHGFENPALLLACGNYLLYNQGNKGYLIQARADTMQDAQAPDDTLAGGGVPKRRYALGMQSPQGPSISTSKLKKSGTVSIYLFARELYYRCGAEPRRVLWGGLYSAHVKREMVSKITVFNFLEQDPIAEYETAATCCWGLLGENGNIMR